MAQNRILIKTTLADLPRLRDRYPFLYLEHGRLEIDDSSVKWISAERERFRLPAATISTLLLGPGTSITHEAVKILASLNTTVCWIGEDSLVFYAVGQTPTANTRNLKKQVEWACNPTKTLLVAQKMFLERFPGTDLKNKKLTDLRTMEGARIQQLYADLAKKYYVSWAGRNYKPGEFEISDLTNQLITSCNAALYALVSSILHSLGLSPRIGFVHSGSPLPFVYDVADLYKEHLVFDLAFSLTREMDGEYNRKLALEKFRERVIAMDFMRKCADDVLKLLELKT